MSDKRKRVLLTFTGPDVQGIVSAVTAVISAAYVRIADIEQIVIHEMIILSLLLDINAHNDQHQRTEPDIDLEQKVVDQLRGVADSFSLQLDVKHLYEDDYRLHSNVYTYAVTCLGQRVSGAVLNHLSSVLTSYAINIDRINKIAKDNFECIELIVRTTRKIDMQAINASIYRQIASTYNVDIALQKENIYRKSKRLVVMDMDSTLIQIEVIDELAALCGIKEQVAAITAQAMDGALDFKQALRERVALLKGLSAEEMNKIRIPYTPGVKKLIKVLKKLGYRTAVISGGFEFFAHKVRDELGLDYAFANKLELANGLVTGRVEGEIIDSQKKVEILEMLAQKEGIHLDQTIAIGDGANDLLMIGRAGLGIAFNAKKKVQEASSYRINHHRIDSILYLLGITEKDLELIDS